jgi:hypothetical protein
LFTIMHERNDGSQEVYSAVRVQFLPFTEENGATAGVHFLCGPHEAAPGISAGHVAIGKVFVMNDKGATVAMYDCNCPKSPPPEYKKYTGYDELKVAA